MNKNSAAWNKKKASLAPFARKIQCLVFSFFIPGSKFWTDASRLCYLRYFINKTMTIENVRIGISPLLSFYSHKKRLYQISESHVLTYFGKNIITA
mgnify:FL=1